VEKGKKRVISTIQGAFEQKRSNYSVSRRGIDSRYCHS